MLFKWNGFNKHIFNKYWRSWKCTIKPTWNICRPSPSIVSVSYCKQNIILNIHICIYRKYFKFSKYRELITITYQSVCLGNRFCKFCHLFSICQFYLKDRYHCRIWQGPGPGPITASRLTARQFWSTAEDEPSFEETATSTEISDLSIPAFCVSHYEFRITNFDCFWWLHLSSTFWYAFQNGFQFV